MQADVDHRNKSGETALWTACKCGNTKMVEILYEHLLKIKSMEQVKQIVNSTDSDGNTLLHIACSKGYQDIIKYLVNKVKIGIGHRNNKNRTALQIADEKGHKSIVSLLSKA